MKRYEFTDYNGKTHWAVDPPVVQFGQGSYVDLRCANCGSNRAVMVRVYLCAECGQGKWNEPRRQRLEDAIAILEDFVDGEDPETDPTAEVLQPIVDLLMEIRSESEPKFDPEGQGKVTTQSHWDDAPKFPVEDWQYEVANDDTRLGYHEWVAAQSELAQEA